MIKDTIEAIKGLPDSVAWAIDGHRITYTDLRELVEEMEKSLEVKDCRAIEGDVGVIISRDTAEASLSAMRKLVQLGEYKSLMADDASFIRANIKELENASI